MPQMTTHEYSEGQVWSYVTRPGEEGSTLVIRAIESYPGEGEVFHIGIEGVKLRNHRVTGGIQATMRHTAVSRQTLDVSVDKAIDIAAPDGGWREGYEIWKQAFDNDDAAVFQIPVAEILDYIERVVASADGKA
jgi:hypothetical protein